ncbi:Signal transduction histidine kinase, homodimeric domain [Pseudocohnilembus persalinus]|uniref:histidine kinase n=1 Tax=Pseudocohnilembus persalinus TaxID=266149 RepID=A0A0V0QT41_PSEPJ|nr:Signal transduction histidine kinase, homodimeric domain [Pseudocohnilembus persalinus]|eukprot:KRX05339.1 Signal transduction histidine kinase, homodimeric domain [Pseudocohnilembus persalinus]
MLDLNDQQVIESIYKDDSEQDLTQTLENANKQKNLPQFTSSYKNNLLYPQNAITEEEQKYPISPRITNRNQLNSYINFNDIKSRDPLANEFDFQQKDSQHFQPFNNDPFQEQTSQFSYLNQSFIQNQQDFNIFEFLEYLQEGVLILEMQENPFTSQKEKDLIQYSYVNQSFQQLFNMSNEKSSLTNTLILQILKSTNILSSNDSKKIGNSIKNTNNNKINIANSIGLAFQLQSQLKDEKQNCSSSTLYKLLENKTANTIREKFKKRQQKKNFEEKYNCQVTYEDYDYTFQVYVYINENFKKKNTPFNSENTTSQFSKQQYFLIFYDISKDIQIQKLTENSKNQDKLLANVSHEIKNPVFGILSYIENAYKIINDNNNIDNQYLTTQKSNEFSSKKQLETPKLDKKQTINNNCKNQHKTKEEKIYKLKKQFQEIENITYMLQFLVNDIRDFELVSRNKLQLFPIKMDIFQCIQEVFNMMKLQFDKKSIKFKVDSNLGQTYNVITDNIRLKQILINLISNAIKYSNHRGIITIKVFEEKDGIQASTFNLNPKKEQQQILKIQVKDNGKGIPEENKKKLFQEFSTFDQNTKSYGVGLGLCVVKNLVLALGPQDQVIHVQSTVGLGSTFSFCIYKNLEILQKKDKQSQKSQIKIDKHRISLPKQSLQLEGMPLNSQNNYIYTEKFIKKQKLNEKKQKSLQILLKNTIQNILIIDDTEFILNSQKQIIKEITQNSEINIWDAENGEQALEIIKSDPKQKIELVIVDKQMTGMDGFETAKNIKQHNSFIKIILCTADNMLQPSIEKNCTYIDTIVTKPLTFANFYDCLVSIFDHQSSTKDDDYKNIQI